MALFGIEKRIAALEKFYSGMDSGILSISGTSEDGKLIVLQPFPGRQLSPSDVAAWKGMVVFVDEAAAAQIAPQTPRRHNVEIVICDDGGININRFNGWKGGPFCASV